MQDTKNFSFKCHRENNSVDIYAVHDISFHPVFGTFATAGANGNFAFWDKDAKQVVLLSVISFLVHIGYNMATRYCTPCPPPPVF